MSAVPYDDDVTNPPPKPLRRPPVGIGGDPLVDAAVRLLSVPLREMYAVLWRVGVIEVLA